MPKPEKIIWNNIKEQDGDDAVLNSQPVQNVLHRAETFADNLLYSLKHKDDNIQTSNIELKSGENPPPKPTFPVPNLQESIGLKIKDHKEESTLYNVTHTEEKLPFESRNILKNISLKVRDFDLFTRLKNNDKTYSLIAGEHFGFGFEQKEGSIKNSITGRYNITNKKSDITFKHKDPRNNYSISCFNQDGNNGVTARYSNVSGLNSAFSVDENSAAFDIGYYKQIDKNSTVEIGAFAATGNNYKKPFVGINASMTF